jgi:hypothetical protein
LGEVPVGGGVALVGGQVGRQIGAVVAAAIEGFDTLLVGSAPDDATRVAMSVVTAGVYGTAINPQLADMSDDDLHRLLLRTSQRLLQALSVPK